MKRSVVCISLVLLSTSAVFAGFDYVIENAYRPGRLELNSQSLLVLGAGAEWIDAKNSSYVEVHGTASPLGIDTGGIWTLDLMNSSALVYAGGETGAVTLSQHATATLKGGRIDYISSYQYVLGPNQTYIPHIEIVCKEHEYDSLTKRLTGVWMDDTTFNIQLVNQSGYDAVIENIFFTPEPATLLLLGAGVMLIRKRR
jgi:hypothetical protein